MMKKTSDTGRMAANLIVDGLAVNAEIALDVPHLTQGVDEAVRKLVWTYGVKDVLAAIHMAAWGAAEVFMDTDDDEDAIAALRLSIFGNRLGEAIKALK